jgi:protocatechuate 3,4-dioxygenase beta subunit
MTDRLFQIGGRVLDQAGRGVRNALVDVLETGVRERTDQTGRFTFGRIAAGPHTLRATAVGFQPRQQALTVPGASEDYVITLAPL